MYTYIHTYSYPCSHVSVNPYPSSLGLPTLHAFGKESLFEKRFQKWLDAATECNFAYECATRWFAYRLDLVTIMMTGATAFLVVCIYILVVCIYILVVFIYILVVCIYFSGMYIFLVVCIYILVVCIYILVVCIYF